MTSDDDEYRIVSAVEYPMHEAAKRGDLEFVRECLKNKVHPPFEGCLKVFLDFCQ